MKLNTIKHIGSSDFVNMGDLRLRQPLPTRQIDMIDPFVLLHHYGPYEISPLDNPFDLGPHPHRGFEPVTFLFQGEQLHRDSLGHESIVRAGDVQWTTAGRGIVHSERPTNKVVEHGGVIEGIQLWLNLPASKKMIPANYQHVKAEDFPLVITDDSKARIKIIAGQLKDEQGPIETQTSVNAYILELEAGAEVKLPIEATHNSLLYLVKGKVRVNNQEVLELDKHQFLEFNNDGVGIEMESSAKSLLLFLSGEPFHEKVSSWGPYVMNTQTEIMEAMRDYQMGKMGFLPAN
jgi:redox-sensitive bicupin YhaK (pirin superfamily)